MYVRQVKQYLRAADEGFDERKWGFATIVEFLRACQREGVFRLERDRQGVLRVFPGANLQRPISQIGTVAEPADTIETPGAAARLIRRTLAGEQDGSRDPSPRAVQAPAVTTDVTDGVTGRREQAERDSGDVACGPGHRTRAHDPAAAIRQEDHGGPAGRAQVDGGEAAAPRAPRARKKAGEY